MDDFTIDLVTFMLGTVRNRYVLDIGVTGGYIVRICCGYLFLFSSEFQVYLRYFIHLLKQLSLKDDCCMLTDVGKGHPFGIIHLGEDRIKRGSSYPLEIVLAYVLDEFHHLNSVTVCLDPISKFCMFVS